MSTGGLRKVSENDLQLVQNLIERCLSLYMSKAEAVNALFLEGKIHPDFTKLVWKKLEEENELFFEAYYVRLMVKQQIMIFHKLLNRQVDQIMQMKYTTGGAVLPNSHGSPFSMSYQTPQCMVVEPTYAYPGSANAIHHPAFHGCPPLNLEMHGFDFPTDMHAIYDTTTPIGKVDISANMPATQNPQVGMISNAHKMALRSEPSYLISDLSISVGADGTLLDSKTAVANPSCTSFSNSESNLPPANDLYLLNTNPSCPWPIRGNPDLLGPDLSQGLDVQQYCHDSPLSNTDVSCFLDFPEDIKDPDQASEAESEDGHPGSG